MKGFGVRALTDFKKGSVVATLSGILFDNSNAKFVSCVSAKDLSARVGLCPFTIDWYKWHVGDMAVFSSTADIINFFNCEPLAPNVEVVGVCDSLSFFCDTMKQCGIDYVAEIVTLRSIKKDEFLNFQTYNNSFEENSLNVTMPIVQ